jgi:serine/threonine protein kinase
MYCFNPGCLKPENSDNAVYCQSCESFLLLHQRYQGLQLLGKGGFGRTLLAIQTTSNFLNNQAQANPCVIKQILQPSESHRLETEVECLSQLGQHPQIPQLLDAFWEKDYFYLVQEWIPGNNLEIELKTQGAFSEIQIWQLLHCLLPILQFIHQHQIIHRDIKPENIIRRSQDQQLCLVDFGAAKHVASLDTVQVGTSIGSPEYVAPEQTRGKAVFASDLYSLGVTCIHLLTELSPFELFDVIHNRWIWHSYLQQPISQSLIDVIDRLLMQPLNQRFRSTDEVLAAIASHPSEAQPEVSVSKPQAPRWQQIHTFTGHRAKVQALAISSDNQLLASGSDDKTVRLWHLPTQQSVAIFQAHTQAVTAVAFHPRSDLLASASNDKTIQIMALPTQAVIATLNGHNQPVKAIAFSDTTLISGSWDKTIKVWSLDTYQAIQTLKGHRLQVSALSISPDGQWLASASYDRTVLLWQFDNPACVNSTPKFALRDHTWAVLSLAFSPDSQLLATGGDDKTIKLWNTATGDLLRTLPGHAWSVVSLAFSPDGKVLFSASSEGMVKQWNLEDFSESIAIAGTDSTNALIATDLYLITAGRDLAIDLYCSAIEN